MTIRQLSEQTPFTTRDGSTIRSILDRSNAPVANQSLAEASLPAGGVTTPHFHRLSEEIYFMMEGEAVITLDGSSQALRPGDAVLIPPSVVHSIQAVIPIRFLCCCAPPYSHEDTYLTENPE